jgi:hypothetical protein
MGGRAIGVRSVVKSYEGPKQISSGAEPYTPTRIDWLDTTLQAALRQDPTADNDFSLAIAYTDSETLVIFVRYAPDVERSRMNKSIEAAHKVIDITVKSYGWQDWIRVKEDVQPYKN